MLEKKMEVSTNVGKAITALQVWEELLHDWSHPDTYEELKNLAISIVETAKIAELVMNGQCQRCYHAFHKGSCRVENDYVYDIWCRCPSST